MNMIEETLLRGLLKELREQNKTLKVIASNQERKGFVPTDSSSNLKKMDDD